MSVHQDITLTPPTDEEFLEFFMKLKGAHFFLMYIIVLCLFHRMLLYVYYIGLLKRFRVKYYKALYKYCILL